MTKQLLPHTKTHPSGFHLLWYQQEVGSGEVFIIFCMDSFTIKKEKIVLQIKSCHATN